MGLADDIINGNRGLAGDIISGNYYKKKKQQKLNKVKQTAVNEAQNVFSTLNVTPEERAAQSKAEYEALLQQGAYEPVGLKPGQSNGTWIDKSVFDDGVNVKSVSKAILGTPVNLAQEYTRGLQSNLEGYANYSADILSLGTEALGWDEATEKLREFAQKDKIGDWDLVNKGIINTNPFLSLIQKGTAIKDNLEDGYDLGDIFLKNNQIGTLASKKGSLSKGIDKLAEGSILGEKSKSLAQTVGQISGQAALTQNGIPWQITAFANSASGEMNNAFNYGKKEGKKVSGLQAFTSGLISGLSEVGTEYIGSGTNKLFGMESLGSKALSKLGSQMGSKVSQYLLKIGFDATSEGTEEVLSDLGTALGQKLTYMSDKEWNELYSSEQAWDSFIMGALGTIITNAPGTFKSVARGENAFTGLTENEQKVLDKVIEQYTNEATKNGKELTKQERNQIEKEAREDLQEGNISKRIIDEVLQKDTDISKDAFLHEALRQNQKRSQSFTTDLSQYKNENQRKIVQKAIDSGILNDSKKTHNFVDLVSKIAADKGMDFDFVNNQKIKDSGFAVEGKTVNGYVNGNTIGLNIESNNALNKTVGHEITHVLEGSDLYQALQDSLKSYIGEAQWNARLKDLAETYKNVENADVTKELTADLVGENLFNNEDFVRSLSTKDRNLFEKIYDEIKYLVKIATAGSKEKRELVKLQKVFQEVYRDSKTTKEGTQYSLEDNPKIYNEVKKYNSMEDFIFESNISYDELEAAGLGGMGEIVEYYNNKNKPILKDYDNTKESATFTEDRLDSIISESVSDYDDNYARAYITHMSPEQFLGLTASEETMQRLNQETGELDVEKLAKERQHIYLDVNFETGKVTGHEGRHRMLALQRAGIKDVEMVVYPDSGTYDRNNAPRLESMNLIGQDFRIGKGTDTQIGELIPVSKANVDELKSNLKTDSKVRYSLTDNQGRQLSEQQQEFFKDSKVRDDEGRLLEVYHGTNSQFNKYNIDKFGKTDRGMYGKGFYFTDDIQAAKEYGNKIKKQYLNIKNPLYIGKGTTYETPSDYVRDIKGLKYDRKTIWEEVQNNTYQPIYAEEITNVVRQNGYDGIIVKPFGGAETEYIVFNSNQIKNVDNTNPTSNPDIRFSLTVQEANTGEDSNGKKLTDEQKEYFKNSKATDENGNLLELYHGTPNGEFFIFDKSYGYSGNDMGIGFYFTNQDSDVETNYVDGGADFDAKVEREAERIENVEEIPYEEAKEKAYNNLYKGGNKITAYLNLENPAIVGQTRLFDTDSYMDDINSDLESEAEYYQEEIEEYAKEYFGEEDISNLSEDDLNEARDEYLREQGIYDDIVNRYLEDDIDNALNKVVSELDLDDENELRDILWEAVYEDGIGINELKDKVSMMGIYDADGEMANNEAVRLIIESLGYDGIIDNTVSTKFKNMGLNEDTTHYIAFKPEQIKRVDNLKPTSNPDIRYSLTVQEADTGTDNTGRELSKEQKEYFKDSKATDENGNLITVYHTMTNYGKQFNEFNPVGSEKYRYGNQTVNFYTDSKEMSGSYADQDYRPADTRRLNTIEEAEDYLKYSTLRIVDLQNTNPAIKNHFKDSSERYYLVNGSLDVFGKYNTEKELLRNVVPINQWAMRNNGKYQYEGYLNMTNPYVVDAKGMLWNRIANDNALEYKKQIKEKWDIPERQLDRLEGDTLKELNRDLTKLGWHLGYDDYGDMALWSRDTELAVDLLNVNDVMQEVRIDLDNDLKTPLTTNDIVFQTLAENEMGSNYDGVIIENVIDNGGASSNSEPNTVYVTFNSNQFKAADNTTPTADSDIRYSLTEMVDSEDDAITQQQFDYFKNTKAVDDLGELWLVHHGTPNEFNIFDIEKAGKTGLMFGNGFYFTNSSSRAEAFTGDNENGLKSGYINIEKPASRDTKTMTYKEFKDLYEALNKNPNLYDEEMGMSNIDALLSDYGDIYNDKEGTLRTFFDSYDNDVNLIDNLSYMANPTEMYKTLRDVTGYDGIIVDRPSDYDSYEKFFIAFNPDQFKLKTNKTPTNDVDMRLSLTRANEDIAPTRGWDVRGRDIALESAIAPLQEQVQQLQNTIEDLRDNIAPISEEEASQLGSQFDENEIAPTRYNLTDQESKRLDILDMLERENQLTDNLAEERNELMAKEENAPEGEDMTPIESLTDVRDMDEVAKDRSVNAYQYEHPEVKPYFQEEARVLLAELNDVIPGERFMIEGRDAEHPTEWLGYKRQASEDVANLLDGYTLGTKYTKDQLREGLNAIIDDHGLENKAVSKRLEFMLDDRLRNGYETIEGYQIEPNQDYLNMLKEQSWDKYYEENPWLENAPAEIEDDVFTVRPQEIAPVRQTRDIMEMVDNEGVRKSTTRNQTPVPRKQKGKVRQAVDTIMGAAVNRNVEIDNLSKASGNRDIKFYGDMLNGAMGEVNYDINTAQTNNRGEAIGKSIQSLFAEAKNKGLGAAFNDFLINYSNIDRYAQGKGSQTPLEVSKRLVRDYAIQHPEFKQWAKDVWSYGKNARQNLVDAGLIDQQTADYLGQIYPHYVPYVSDYENADAYFEGVGELKPRGLKRARGGAGALLSVEDALARYTYAQKNAVRQNELYKEIVHTLGQVPSFGIDERTDYTDMRDSLFTDRRGNYLTAYEDGKQITTQVSSDLYKELSRTTENNIKDLEKKLSILTTPLQKISEVRKNLITTWNPTFPVTNAIKDLQDALFNSKHTKDMVKNYPGALKELATGKGKEVNQFLALYGSGLTMGEYSSDAISQATKKVPLLNKIRQINEIVELAPRYAEFKASLQNGETLQEAIYNAREVTTNFNRGGNIAKAMNRNGFTFLNASIQGFDKFIRNFSGENGARGIVQSLAKVAALGILPALFNHLAYDDDEEYEELKDYIKDNYYLIKTGDGKFIRIPKGRMLSIFGSAARRALESASGEENAFEGYLGNAWNQIGINDPGENNIFAPFIQAFGSKNGTAWYGGDIVPSRLQSEKAKNQYDEKTDKFSIWLGGKLGVSPKKINYVLDQYLGGIGDVALPMGTEAATSEADSVGEYILAPWADKFTADSVEDSKYSSDFYNVKSSIPHGENATDEEKLQYKYMDAVSWELTELYAKKREIQKDSSLTKKEKYNQAKEIQREINEKAKQALEDYKKVEVNEGYASVNGVSYKKSNEGKWEKVRVKKSS